MRGERNVSESARESSRRGPGRAEEELGEGGCGEAGADGEEESLSIKDLHCCESLEWPFRQEAFLMIFS